MSVKKLWEADLEAKNNSEIQKYINWLRTNEGVSFNNYVELWQWSINNIEAFWESIINYFDVEFKTPYKQVLDTQYGGKSFNKLQTVKEIISHLPTLEKIIVIPYLNEVSANDVSNKAILWNKIQKDFATNFIEFEYVDNENWGQVLLVHYYRLDDVEHGSRKYAGRSYCSFI